MNYTTYDDVMARTEAAIIAIASCLAEAAETIECKASSNSERLNRASWQYVYNTMAIVASDLIHTDASNAPESAREQVAHAKYTVSGLMLALNTIVFSDFNNDDMIGIAKWLVTVLVLELQHLQEWTD